MFSDKDRRYTFGFFKKKKKIVLPVFKKKLTLEEVGLATKLGSTYYFRIEEADKLTLYVKTPIGYKPKYYKLPLKFNNIAFISNKCKGNKKFWENLMTDTLRKHWSKYEGVL